MEILIIIGSILAVLGIIGSIVPGMPGPILSFLSLILLYFFKGSAVISISALVMFGVVMVILQIIDYIAPVLGAKYFGASKSGIWGSVIGAILGLIFFPPLGIILGALIGAVLGELKSGKEKDQAFKAALGVVSGSVGVTVLEVIYSIIAAVYYFKAVI